VKPALSILLAGVLVACGASAGPAPTDTPGVSRLPDALHLEQGTLDRLFSSAGAYLQTSGDLQVVAFRCTVVEGTFCWFGQQTQDGPVPADLARTVVDQLGPRAIENANRNEVAVQCYRPTDGGDPYCEIDWGWGEGWQALELD
jgi:hypothetical protein